MRIANAILLFVNAILLVMTIWFLSSRGVQRPQTGWEYKDLLTILLAVLGTIITAVTIFIGIAAIWGYSVLRQAAEAKAAEVAHATAAEVAESVAARIANDAVELNFGSAGKIDLSQAGEEEK